MDDKELLKLLNEIEKKWKDKISGYSERDSFRLYIKDLKRKYGLLPKFPTLKEYLRDNSSGAYNRFRFYIPHTSVYVSICDISDFNEYYNSKYLDLILVTKETNGCPKQTDGSTWDLDVCFVGEEDQYANNN